MTKAHHPTPEEAAAVIYDGQGKITDKGFAFILVRGIGGAVDYVVARDSKRYSSSLTRRYGLELGIRASGAIQGQDVIPRIVFYGSVDGRKTAQELRRSALRVPAYIQEIVLAGDLQQALYPPIPGVRQVPPRRFGIFDFGNDVNAGPEVKEQAQKLRLPLDRILDVQSLETFGDSDMISGIIAAAVEMRDEYNIGIYHEQRLKDAFGSTPPVEVVEFLWRGRNNIRQESMDYGKVLYRDSMRKLEERIRQCPDDKPELKRLMESSHAFLAQFGRIIQ